MEARSPNQIASRKSHEDNRYILESELSNKFILNEDGSFGMIYTVTWQNQPAVLKVIEKKTTGKKIIGENFASVKESLCKSVIIPISWHVTVTI